MTTDRLQVCLLDVKMILPRAPVEPSGACPFSIHLSGSELLSVPFCSEAALLPDGSAYADQLQALFSATEKPGTQLC